MNVTVSPQIVVLVMGWITTAFAAAVVVLALVPQSTGLFPDRPRPVTKSARRPMLVAIYYGGVTLPSSRRARKGL